MNKHILFIVGVVLICLAGRIDAATRVFQTAGNWGTLTNWQGSLKPGSGDDVIIAANCTVNEDISIFTFASVTVNAGINLMLMQYPLVFSGTVTNNGFIYTECTTNAPLPSGKSWGSYVFFSAAGAQTVPSGSYYSLKTSASGTSRTVSAGGDITVTHELYVEGFTNTNQTIFDLGPWRLLGTPSYTYVTGKLRTANTSAAPLPPGMRWYSNMPGRQGVVEFYSASPQSIPGGTYDDDLILAASTKTLTGVLYSNGILTLNQAILRILDSGAVIGVTGTIGAGAGIFSSSNMIATMGTGALLKRFSAGGSFLYPIGELTGTAEYSPATLTFPATTGTFSASALVVDAVHPQNPSSASYISRYWRIDVVSTAGRNGSITLTYVDADVVAPEQNMYTGQWTAAQWQQRNKADTLLNRLSASGVPLTGDFTGYEVLPPQACTIDARVLLHGPAIDSSGTMTTALNASNRIPQQQPYNTSPWNYPGSESVASIPTGTVVDWVLLELRSTSTGAAVARRAGFLLSDGAIKDLDASSPVTFSALSAGNYYLVVRHRNHLAVMSASALPVSPTTPHYDFTTAQSQAWGSEPMVGLASGRPPFALWGGDANADSRLKYAGSSNDPAFILQRIGGTDITATITGYHREDTNLDGVVQYSGAGNDRAMILRNIGGVIIGNERLSSVP